MEKMLGGDLIQQIISKSHYKEADAKAVCHNLLLGIQYCHNRSIAIRNIKPENLLLSSPGDDTNVKLSDFGYAKKVLYPNSLRTQCGTEGYTAPEILSHRPEYDVPCDMWSLGVVMYILIGGYRPFRGTGTEIIRQIRYGEYEVRLVAYAGLMLASFLIQRTHTFLYSLSSFTTNIGDMFRGKPRISFVE